MRPVHLTLLLSSAACSISGGVATSTEAIVGGTVTPGDPAVVALVAGEAQFCTGSLIAPNIVLTAAHCLPPNAPFPLEDIEVFFGSDVAQGGARFTVVAAQAHPEWADNTLANDIGLIALQEPATVEPLRMLADLGEAGLLGASTRVIGFGTTTRDGVENGVKRSGQMTVDELDESTIYLSGGPALTCSGDSGGPLLVSLGSGELVAGIHSRSDCEIVSLAERVDRHLEGLLGDFMLEFAEQASCGADGLCASGCLEPDSDCGPPIDSTCEGDATCSDDEVIGACTAGGEPESFLSFLVLFLLARRRFRSNRGARRSALVVLVATLLACGAVDEAAEGGEGELADGGPGEILSYDAFVENYIHVFAGADGTEWLTYDDDVVLDSWDDVRLHYQSYREVAASGRSTSAGVIDRALGSGETWPQAQQTNLTYCVSNEFFYARPLMVEAIEEAARSWEAVADVRFVHLEEHADSCNIGNDAVVFRVVLATWGPLAPHATAFRPLERRRKRTIAINLDAVVVRGEGADTTLWSGHDGLSPMEGVIRHQLGHVLGLAHQFGPTGGSHCLARALDYEGEVSSDENSSMLTASCVDWSTAKNKALELSIGDGDRAAQLYP